MSKQEHKYDKNFNFRNLNQFSTVKRTKKKKKRERENSQYIYIYKPYQKGLDTRTPGYYSDIHLRDII